MNQLNLKIKQMYEHDYVLWLDKTIEQLRQKDIVNLDWEHLLEELTALGNEQRRKVESYLKQLLKHLLLYQYWESERIYCARGWQEEIDNFRDELEFLFRSKTLYNYGRQQFESIYVKARRQALSKTGLPPQTIPVICPYSFEEVINWDFRPDI
jgi:hypothetical protein